MDPKTVLKGEQIDEVIPDKVLRTITPLVNRRGVEIQLFKNRETGEIILKESKYYRTTRKEEE